MFSMAGVPPMVGFFAKLWVFTALIHAGYITLAVIALLFALVGAFYYIRVVKVMYFDAPDDVSPIVTPMNTQLALSINSLALLALGIFPAALMQLCRGVF